MKKKPTIEQIVKLADDVETNVYSEVFEEFSEDERFYNLDFKADLDLPEDFSDIGIVLPTARDMVDANVDHIDINNARVKVNRAGEHDSNFKQEEAKRKFCLGVIWRSNVEKSISQWRIAAKHYALHGVCHFKTVWDADLWYDKPEQGKLSEEEYASELDKWNDRLESTFPIQILAIHPGCIMPDPYHITPEFCIEKHTKTAGNVINSFPHWTNPKGRDTNQLVDWIEYWDSDYRAMICDGESILKSGVVKHKYGFIPYVTIEAGLGNLSLEADYIDRYVGTLRHMKDILIAESRAYSIADYILKCGAWPWGVIEGDDNGAVTEIKQRFGVFQPLPTGVTLKPMPPDVPPEALNRWMDITSDYISAHSAPRSTRGLSEAGVRSGADRRLIMSEASLKFAHSIPAFRHGTARVLENCIRLYKYVIPYDVKLWSNTPADDFEIKIKREDLKEPFNCDIEFSPISEEDEIRRHDDLRLQVQAFGLPKEYAWKQLSNIDPIAMSKLVEESRVRDSQGLNQVKEQYIMQKAQLAFAQAQAAQMLQEEQKTNPIPQGQQGIAGFPTPQLQQGLTTNIPQQQGAVQQIQNANKATKMPAVFGQGQGGGGARRVS